MRQIIWLSAIAVIGLSTSASALDVGQKDSFSAMETSLAQDHQVEVARGRYILNPENAQRMKDLCIKITINAKGDAYILLSDGVDDSKSTIELVYGKLRNARTYDPNITGVLPAGVSPESDLGMKIKKGATNGDGVMMHGQSVKRMPDGTESIVGTTTIMGNLSDTPVLVRRGTIAILLTGKDGDTNLDSTAGQLLYRYNEPAKPKR